MPGGDGTGPAGLGPMTGRAAGHCAGLAVPGFMNAIPGRGFPGWGRGRGGGGGWRRWFHGTGLPGWQRTAMGWPARGGPWPSSPPQAVPFAAAATTEQELAALKAQAEHLEDALDGVKKRIAELQDRAVEKPEE